MWYGRAATASQTVSPDGDPIVVRNDLGEARVCGEYFLLLIILVEVL